MDHRKVVREIFSYDIFRRWTIERSYKPVRIINPSTNNSWPIWTHTDEDIDHTNLIYNLKSVVSAQKQAGEVANLKAEISRLKEAEQGLQDAKERCDAHERSKAEYKLKIDKLSQEKQSLMSERNQLE